MSKIYSQLVERIRNEVSTLDNVVHRVNNTWTKFVEHPEEDAYLDAVALNLHSFYSGLERLFELIARHVDEIIPEGKHWHQKLLSQMATDLRPTRPSVISGESAKALDEYRRFRHLVRNVYTLNLVPERMERLTQELPRVWATVRREMLAFAEFLEAIDD